MYIYMYVNIHPYICIYIFEYPVASRAWQRAALTPSLSLFRTHTHTHTLSLSLSHTHTHALSLSLSVYIKSYV